MSGYGLYGFFSERFELSIPVKIGLPGEVEKHWRIAERMRTVVAMAAVVFVSAEGGDLLVTGRTREIAI